MTEPLPRFIRYLLHEGGEGRAIRAVPTTSPHAGKPGPRAGEDDQTDWDTTTEQEATKHGRHRRPAAEKTNKKNITGILLMKRKWLRWVSWIILTPIILFIIVATLLYVPPIQNFLRNQAVSYASEATDMQIEVGRIRLKFPLKLSISDVSVMQETDTILNMDELDVKVQLMPLMKGQVEVDNVTLLNILLNTNGLIDGMQLKGKLGRLYLASHGVDIPEETAIVNVVELSDTQVELVLTESTSEEDTTQSALPDWAVALERLKVSNLDFSMKMPDDSLALYARMGDLLLSNVKADLAQQSYSLQSLLLKGGKVNYDYGCAEPDSLLDFDHIHLDNLKLRLDSALYSNRQVKALLKNFQMDERSGFSISSLKAQIVSDSTRIHVPQLELLTPNSNIRITANTNWEMVDTLTNGHLSARLHASIGPKDVLLLSGSMPKEFKEAYPDTALVIKAGTEGNLSSMQLSGFRISLPGALDLKSTGNIYHITDSVKRAADFNIEMKTGDLNFLTGLAGIEPHTSLVVPDSMDLNAAIVLKDSQLNAQLNLMEGNGKMDMEAEYHLISEAYKADVRVDNLHVNHFLPHDSIYNLSVSAQAQGKGIDFMSPAAKSQAKIQLKQLVYGKFQLSDIELDAELLHSVATAHFESNNPLVRMKADAEYNLSHNYPDGKVAVQLYDADLYSIAVIEKPFEKPLDIQMEAEVRNRLVKAELKSGDLAFYLKSPFGLNTVLQQSEVFAKVLEKQIEARFLDHKALREALPTGGFGLNVGRDNPAAWYLEAMNITFDEMHLRFGATPDWGVNALARIQTLRYDTLQFDTVSLVLDQDTTRLRMKASVHNNAKNPQIEFLSNITAEVRDQNAEVLLEYQNKDKETGLLFGVNARPWTNARGESNGFILTLIPDKPVIAYQPFEFEEMHNWAYLHKNMRVYANIFMQDPHGTALRLQSLPTDTVSLQNMDVELRKIPLDKVFTMFPYLPEISGELNAEAHYIQTEQSLQLATEIDFDQLAYEKKLVGDVGISATWLPGENQEQFIDAVIAHNGEEVVMANGMMMPDHNGEQKMDFDLDVENLPLTLANVFVPEELLQVKGNLDSHLNLKGGFDKPLLEGGIAFDSTSVYIPQADANFALDTREVRIERNKLLFDKYAIFASGKTPFNVTGEIDMKDLTSPMANLKLTAKNYTLLNAKRRRNSLVYGKVFVDVDAVARGPLDELLVRGNINLLNSTDVTYVLKDSPLTVEDRLSELVTFTSFNDTIVEDKKKEMVSLGGLDAIMMIHIDPTVSVGVDLSNDRNNRIKLVGGGDLALQLTPQGDMSLTGRYTLSGGLLKFSPLPVIPTKEFAINKNSYVEWTGDVMDPKLNFKAINHVRTSVPVEDGNTRMVDFDVSVIVKNTLEDLNLEFGIDAPEDAYMQNKLISMGKDDRNIQAIGMLATGFYLGDMGKNDFDLSKKMGSALSSVVSSQINALAGNLKGASFQFGMEDHDATEAGGKRTDYSFKYSQRFFNDRFQIVLGGKVSTGENATNEASSFIDNISLEYRLDASGTRYVRLFYDKNYDSVFEGEVTETGAGIVLRKRMNKLKELFLFKRKEENENGEKKEKKERKAKKEKKDKKDRKK